MMMMMMMILLVVLGLSVSVTHAAERGKKSSSSSSSRGSNLRGYDDDDDDDDDGRRGINVGEDPNVHQFKKGTDEHVEVLTAENFKKLTTGRNTCWSRFTRLGMATRSRF